MHLRILFLLDFFVLSIPIFVSLIAGQAVFPSTKNDNRWSILQPGKETEIGYEPSRSETYAEAVSNLNDKKSNYGLQLGSNFNHPFNQPIGYASSPLSNYRNAFNMQQAIGNTADSGLGNLPVNNQNNRFSNGNADMTTFPGGTVPISNRNVVTNSGSFYNGAMETIPIGNVPGSEQNGFKNGPLSNIEVKTFSGVPVASQGYVGNENLPTAINNGVLPSKGKNNRGFDHGLPFNPTVINSENSQFEKTAIPDRATALNTSNEESYILQESDKTTEVHGRKQAAQKRPSGTRRRFRSKNHSRRKSSQPKISSDSDVQDARDIINGTDVKNVEQDTNVNISTATPETSSVPAKNDLPLFLASAVDKFDTPSTVHYISSAVSLLVSDDEFDLASLPSVILALTMQIRSAFPGLSNCELLNQVFLEMTIALGHILKHSKVGDVQSDSIAETAELVLKAF